MSTEPGVYTGSSYRTQRPVYPVAKKHKKHKHSGGAQGSSAEPADAGADKSGGAHEASHARAAHARASHTQGGKHGEHGGAFRRWHRPNWLLLAPAAAGVALTAYLTVTAWQGAELALCGADSDCDIVQSSRWGTFLGLPTSAWGLLAYLVLAYVALRVRNAERQWKLAWLISLTGLAYSLYLTGVAVLVFEATCTYCLISLGLMAASFGITLAQRPPAMPEFRYPAWVAQTAVIALVLVGGVHLYYSGWLGGSGGPEDPYLQSLAEHVTRSGATFYGAFW